MAPSVTFAVDDVIPAPLPIQECDLAGSLAARLEEPVLGSSHGPKSRFVPPQDTHPLMAAVHLAFSEHRPLVLSPDIVWTTIAQGLALHIVRNAEALRFDLVRHQGKKQLVVQRMSVDLYSTEFWNDVVGDFSAMLKEESTALHGLIVCDFSTTGPVERVVSQVVLMDALSKYFDYSMECICGIPTVTLEGTPADWSRLREKAAQLSHYGLDWWAKHLLPICDQFVRASQGNADRAFWKDLYKPRKIYDGEVINGWSCKLFPFLRNDLTRQYDVRSPVFESEAGQYDGEEGMSAPPGFIQSKSLPTGLSRVPLSLQVQTREGTKRRSLALTAGFLGVSQSSSTMALRPELGWVVHDDLGLDALSRRVREEGETMSEGVGRETSGFMKVLQHESSRRRKLEKLIVNERLRAESELLRGVTYMSSFLSRELNTPLGFVRFARRHLEEDLAAPSTMAEEKMHEVVEVARDVEERLQRLHSMFVNTLGFGGREATKFSLAEAVRLAAWMTPRQHWFWPRLEVPEDLPQVLAVAPQLTLAIRGLLVNASDALEESPSREKEIQVVGRSEGSTVLLLVEDNGPGFPPEVLPRIFQRFFTTKNPEKHAGLGLSLAREAVEQAGGTLRAENRPEGGARLRLTLPAYEPRPGRSS